MGSVRIARDKAFVRWFGTRAQSRPLTLTRFPCGPIRFERCETSFTGSAVPSVPNTYDKVAVLLMAASANLALLNKVRLSA